ncbi:MAG: glutathione S-transferase family protein [Gammaproteobacteria bacterium]|nr:glutathione S-transferase family protein [Gammaproteobacteria bacterium]
MITLYGITQSRAFRPLWLLYELGLPFEHVKLNFRGDDIKDPTYRALNPNGRVPTLVDGDLVLWESMAINLYLARKYGTGAGLWPETVEDEGRAMQWSFWVMTEVEHPLLTVLMHSRVLPEDQRDADKASRNRGLLKAPFSVLDAALADRDYLAGDRFTVADLNVAAVLSWCKPARFGLKDYPNLSKWLDRCLDRPARRQAQVA